MRGARADGQGLVEYALLLALTVVAVVGAVTFFGAAVKALLDNASQLV